MFSSDDSLFEEMTKQLEDDTNKNSVKRKSPTSTITSASTSTQNQDTLPDIVYSGKRSDAVTGLLMLGADPEQLDAEIYNELIMPVNKPKQPDISKAIIDYDIKKDKKFKNKKRARSRDCTESPRRSTRQNLKSNSITSMTTEFPSSPKSPGSPRGVFKVTCYELRKGTPNKYMHKPLKCSMCEQIVNSKDELRTHNQEVHNIIACKDCDKGFTTKQSLRKHSYSHTTTNSYKCLLCKRFFVFPSELDAHLIKPDTLPNFNLIATLWAVNEPTSGKWN